MAYGLDNLSVNHPMGGPGTVNMGSFSGGGGGGTPWWQNLGNFMSGDSGQGLMQLGSLALGTYGLGKSLGFAEDQMDILKQQENRASTAQNLQTGNNLSLALQLTQPGTPEHERVKQAIAEGTYSV